MEYVAQGQTLGCALPALRLFTVFADSTLADAEVCEFRIVDSDGAEVFPTLGGGPTWEVVDTTDVCPTGAKLGTGTYAATGWTVDAAQAVGQYTVQQRYKEFTEDADYITIERAFEVIAEAANVLSPAYASVADLREEGVTVAMASDRRLHKRIVQASRMIERWTKRSFVPQYKSVRYNGSGSRKLLLDDPIIAIARAAITTLTSSLAAPEETGVDRSLFFVYNRHLTADLTSPDDRNNPKLEYFHGDDLQGHSSADAIAGLSFGGLVWPRGPQLIRVEGLFGYTEYDGTALGQTPELIALACTMLVIRNLATLTDVDGNDDAKKRWRLLSETTRDQSYRLADLTTRGASNSRVATGALTGDPEIDNLIIPFMRPPTVRAV